MAKTKWCDTCKFMTYGNCHSKTEEQQPPNDYRIIMPSKTTFVPFNSTYPVGGNAVANIPAQPQMSGRPLHLAVDPACAPHFFILDIRIGNLIQTASVGRMPAACFAPMTDEKSWLHNLQGISPWSVGMMLLLLVENRTPYAHEFNAVMKAEILETALTPAQMFADI